MTNNGWHLRWLRRWDEVLDPAFVEVWRTLAEATTEPAAFQHPNVVVPWIEEVARPAGLEPAFALANPSPAKAAGTFQTLLPAVVVGHRGRLARRRVLEPVLQDLAGYHGPLWPGTPPAAVDWAGFWRAVQASSAAFVDQARFRLVQPAFTAGTAARPASDGSPVFDFPQPSQPSDLDALLAATSANHRGDVRRRLRRLEELGDVTFWSPSPHHDAAALAASFDSGFVPAYQALWRAHPAGSLLDRAGVLPFLRRLATSGAGHYSALSVGGRQIGWHLGLHLGLHRGLASRGELYWWFPTYASSWENFSPGKVLLALLLAHGAAAGWRRVHFLTGNHPYKLAWGTRDAGLQTLTWYPPTVRGRLFAFYDRPRSAEGTPRD